MASKVPQELRYTEQHEWARLEEDGSVTMGITDYAQSQLGAVVFVELEVDLGEEVEAGEEFMVIDSHKTASDVYAPCSGTVVAFNEELEGSWESVNEDCYGAGWLAKFTINDASELDDLMDAAAYVEHVGEEDD